jgi:hypothetical protein
MPSRAKLTGGLEFELICGSRFTFTLLKRLSVGYDAATFERLTSNYNHRPFY